MSGQWESTDCLQDILDAMEKALEFVRGLTYEEFAQDDRTVFAVTRALEIIGEATRRVPQSIRAEHAEVPWRLMAGIRDKLIHDYSGVDLRVVWRTVQEDVPMVKPQIAAILAGFETGPDLQQEE